MLSLKNYLYTLNLFQSSGGVEPENDDQQRTSRITTRVYLILLFVILMAFILAISLIKQTNILIIENPTQTQFESLPDATCPCSRISLSYGEFVSTHPSFHQVCSSDFVSDRWISLLYNGMNTTYFLPTDIRSSGFALFQALASFCRLAQENVNQSLSLFGSTSFMSLFAISESVLQSQVRSFINQFQLTAPNTLQTHVQLVSNMNMPNKIMNGLGTGMYLIKSGITESIETIFNIYVEEDRTWCTCMEKFNCTGPSGIYKEFNIETNGVNEFTAKMIIPGLRSGCMPVDACLHSSLECFFDQTCVNDIISYLTTPHANFTAMIWLPSSRFPMNWTINSIVGQLMVEEWGFNISYDQYYAQCAPLSCRYSITRRYHFLYVLPTLIGLLGGLCTGLKIIARLAVRFIQWLLKLHSAEPRPQVPYKDRLRQLKIILKRALMELNLFEVYPSDDRQVCQQRIITRLYIAITLCACIIFTLYLALNRKTYRETLKNPTQSQFVYLQSLYSTSLECPCSSVSNSYNTFLSVEPHYHQLCVSDFVSITWLSWLNDITISSSIYREFRITASSHFQILASFCKHANKTITDALQQLLQEKYVTAQVVSHQLFESHVPAFIEDWKAATINNFLRTLKLIQGVHQGNHLSAAFYNMVPSISDSGNFRLNSFQSHSNGCSCLLLASCHSLMAVYDPYISDSNIDLPYFVVPGFFTGCFPVDAMLISTLECFYSEYCMESLIRALQQVATFAPNITYVPLNASQNQPNETIGSVVNRLFVVNWSHSISYKAYYQACLPQSCTFEYTRRPNILSVVTTIIGIFGGLSTGLEIVFLVLLRILVKVRMDRSFRAHLRSISNWLFTSCNRQYLASRLNTVFLITALAILYLLFSITPHSRTEHVFKPSFQTYEQLHFRYATVQCPCSQLSIQYKYFMNLTVTSQHQVCTSDFVSIRWIEMFLLSNNLSAYSPYEFRKIAISHFQLLAFLCQYTQQYLNETISNFISKNFIESYLLSSSGFEKQIQSNINQFQLTITNSFLITLQLIRDTTSDNKLISIFESNWKWLDLIDNSYIGFGPVLRTKAMVYNACDCGLSSKCVQPGIVSNNLTIPRLMVGCYPLESLLKSTLECFYDASCFSLLQTLNGLFTPLDASLPSRYQLNSSVEFIISQLMIEEWSSNISYKNYYTQCAPSYCSYSYLKHGDILDALMNLLELYGGLVIIINVLVLILLALWKKIINHRQANQIQPVRTSVLELEPR